MFITSKFATRTPVYPREYEVKEIMRQEGNRPGNGLFLGLGLSDIIGKNITVRRGNVRVVVLNSFCDLEPEFLIEVYGVFIIRLHVQINFRNVLLGAEIKNVVQQRCTCKSHRSWIRKTCTIGEKPPNFMIFKRPSCVKPMKLSLN